MGARPYWYFVPYQEDVKTALNELREREFRAGRYNPAHPDLFFPLDPDEPDPGAQHDSIEAAMEAAEEEGTRSILDIGNVGKRPDFGTAGPLPKKVLKALYGTDRPTREMVDGRKLDLFEHLERGQCAYVILYRDDAPDEIFFAGYSFD